VWENDGEEQVETVALGWTGRIVYVRIVGPATGSPRTGSTRPT
jgi:hypothetical protein